MSAKIVSIDLDERSYDIYIGEALIPRISELLPMDIQGGAFFIVTDRHVQNLAHRVQDLLNSAGARNCKTLVLEPGEKTKSFTEFEKTVRWMLQNNVDRSSTLIAIGGGVIGDLGGYAAASTMRGINFVQVPTTLLSQVDSSVGGKTGINTPEGKNLVGAFYQPKTVITDIDSLQTLPKRELLAGYAECVKHAAIADAPLFAWYEQNYQDILALDPEVMAEMIERNCRIKAAVVQSDEREKGRRALLNLGHTFGHALEAAAGYNGTLLHGEAVAIGMVMALDLSVRLGDCPTKDLERLEEHLINVGLPTRASMIDPALKASPEALMNIMKRDKKSDKGSIKFVISGGIGEAFTRSDVSWDLVKDVLVNSLGPNMSNTAKTPTLAKRWKSAFSSLASQFSS